MKKLEWQDDLSVGIELIDGQHKQWIEHFNRAAEAVAAHQGAMHITKTLGFLVEYTEAHFSTEERHMAASHYAGVDEHKAKHDELKAIMADLVQDFEEEGVNHKLANAVDAFLGNWLVKHIQDVDMKFGAFVKTEGILLSDDT